MAYRVIFDAATEGYQGWGFVAGGLLMTLVGGALVLGPAILRSGVLRRDMFPDVFPELGAARGRVFAWSFFLFALALTIPTAWTVSSHVRLKNASLNRTCNEVSGIVSDFVPEPNIRADESFAVNGILFRYNDSKITGGFNRSAARGSPLREGLPVRICYVQSVSNGNVIVRLEIAR